MKFKLLCSLALVFIFSSCQQQENTSVKVTESQQNTENASQKSDRQDAVDSNRSPNFVSVDEVNDLILPNQPKAPELTLPEIDNCPNGCCALRAISASDYPKETVTFPQVKPEIGATCVQCKKNIDRISTPLVGIINEMPVFFCSTGCYSYLMSDPKTYLANYRKDHGFPCPTELEAEDEVTEN